MKKLSLIVLALITLTVSAFAGMKLTSDMKKVKDEYSSEDCQWKVKESLGMLMSEITYGGWKASVDKKGKKTVNVIWKSGYTEKPLKKKMGNSTQTMYPGIATLIGDKVAPVTDEEGDKLYTDLQTTLIYEDLRIKYDNNYKNFQEEFELLKEYGIISATDENEVLQKYAKLVEWRDNLIDEISELEE